MIENNCLKKKKKLRMFMFAQHTNKLNSDFQRLMA